MICANYGIPHIVNNAYGVQSSKCMHLIQQVREFQKISCQDYKQLYRDQENGRLRNRLRIL